MAKIVIHVDDEAITELYADLDHLERGGLDHLELEGFDLVHRSGGKPLTPTHITMTKDDEQKETSQ